MREGKTRDTRTKEHAPQSGGDSGLDRLPETRNILWKYRQVWKKYQIPQRKTIERSIQGCLIYFAHCRYT